MAFEQFFFIVWIIGATSLISIFIIKGRKAVKIFPVLDRKDFEFYENHASGYSTQSFITKIGGANKVLRIRVTKDELWLTTNSFMAWIAKRYDLLHKIPLKSLESVKSDKKHLLIDFKLNGDRKQVVVISRKQEELENLLKHKIVKNKS